MAAQVDGQGTGSSERAQLRRDVGEERLPENGQVQGHGRFQTGMVDPWPFLAEHEEVEEGEVSLINLVELRR
jgi:hypothetical protein